MEFKGRQLHAGDLRNLITIERDETVRSSTGSKLPWQTPQTVCEVWAAMVYELRRSGGENVGRDSPVSIQEVSFYLRRRLDVHPKMRVKLATRFFEIGAIQLDEKSFMKLSCVEVIHQ